MLGSWWLSPAGSQGARPGQPHEPRLIHTANAMHTHGPTCSPVCIYCMNRGATMCVCVWKRWCWMIMTVKHRAKWNCYNSLMLIKIDMLLIIFRPDSVFSHPASCTLLLKISNNHKGQQSFPSFPKSNCWKQVNVVGSQLRTNKAIALSQPEQNCFQQSGKLWFLTVTDSTSISIKMTSCITVMTWQTLRYRTYHSTYSSVTP